MIPLPRPEYELPNGGHANFEVGDIVRWRDTLDEDRHLIGVVVVEALRANDDRPDWFVKWEDDDVSDFDNIAGDDLIVVFSNRWIESFRSVSR